MDTTPQRKVLAVCLVVVLALVGLAVIVGTVESPTDDIGFELRKYIMQFLLIVALGAVVAFLVDDMKRRAERADEARRERREADARERQHAIDTFSSLLERLDAIYRRVKRTRRFARLVSVEDLSREAYMDAMSKLSDDKLDIEQLDRDIDTLQRWLPGLVPLRSKIQSMERYLGLLEDEWEVAAPTDGGFKPEQLAAFRRFVLKTKEGSDFFQFRNAYYEARSALTVLLADERVGVALPDTKPLEGHGNGVSDRPAAGTLWRRDR